MRFGKVRLDLEGFGVAGYCLFRLPDGLEDIAKIVMRLSVVRP